MLIEVLKQARKECSIEREFVGNLLYPYLDAYRVRSVKTRPFARFLEKLIRH